PGRARSLIFNRGFEFNALTLIMFTPFLAGQLEIRGLCSILVEGITATSYAMQWFLTTMIAKCDAVTRQRSTTARRKPGKLELSS
ncbi:hypothetical protein N8198_09890, partial [Gammaproteobacteria bacterium]|nr:hypothetical protein [Gammaproteobacteria bacterium]